MIFSPALGQIPESRIARSRDIYILNFDIDFLLGVLQKGYRHPFPRTLQETRKKKKNNQ